MPADLEQIAARHRSSHATQSTASSRTDLSFRSDAQPHQAAASRARLDRPRHQSCTRMGPRPDPPPRRPTRLPDHVALRTLGTTTGRSGTQRPGRPGDPPGTRPPRPARTQRGHGDRRCRDRPPTTQLRAVDDRSGEPMSTLVIIGLAITIAIPLLVIAATIWWP